MHLNGGDELRRDIIIRPRERSLVVEIRAKHL